MDAQLKAKWVEALRSGEFNKARYKLRYRSGLCCIGVCHKVATGETPQAKWQTMAVAHRLGLSDEQINILVNLNDYEDKTFPEIADYIEANL